MTPRWRGGDEPDGDDERLESEPWDSEDEPYGRFGDDRASGPPLAAPGAVALDEDDEWTEDDERRYQARRQEEHKRVVRRRRQAAAFAVVVLIVLGIGVTAAGVYQGLWSWPLIGGDDDAQTQSQPCPTATPTAAAAAEVTTVVLNSTDRAGLAGAVAAELQARGFVVREIGNDPAETPVAEAAQVRHGPEGLTDARTVAAHIRGAVLVDDGREGQVVTVSLGTGYVDMLPPAEAAALLTPPAPPSPAGCVPATPSTSPSAPTTTTATTTAAPTG